MTFLWLNVLWTLFFLLKLNCNAGVNSIYAEHLFYCDTGIKDLFF